MKKQRLEYFSDAVIAIIITIMVLELKPPHGTTLADLKPLLPRFYCYILSFIFLATYWNNHHHLLQYVNAVNGKVLLANLHLLFWLSLIPFQTAWLSENKLATVPALLYGINLLMAALAYCLLTSTLIKLHSKDSTIVKAIGKGLKGKLTITLYCIGISATFIRPWFGFIAYIIVALLWIIPDSRFEKITSTD